MLVNKVKNHCHVCGAYCLSTMCDSCKKHMFGIHAKVRTCQACKGPSEWFDQECNSCEAKGEEEARLKRLATFPFLDEDPEHFYECYCDEIFLIYFGAGHDLSTLQYGACKFQIFVDALPRHTHYKEGTNGYEVNKDEKSFIMELHRQLKHYDVEKFSKSGDVIHVCLRNGIQLYYFMNTTVEQFVKEQPRLLKQISVLMKKGFEPFSNGLTAEMLPELEYETDGKKVYDRGWIARGSKNPHPVLSIRDWNARNSFIEEDED